MMWQLEILIIAFVFYESVIISIYKLIYKSNPQWGFWIILGSKGLKFILTVGGILAVKILTEVPLKRFALMAVAVYLVSVIFETFYFFKKTNNEQNK